MKQALPLETTKQFLTDLKNQFGKIESKEFISFHQETYAVFKTNFENTVLAINISLNNHNQINRLFIKPYEEPIEAESKTVNALNDFPIEISEIIFSKTKELLELLDHKSGT